MICERKMKRLAIMRNINEGKNLDNGNEDSQKADQFSAILMILHSHLTCRITKLISISET